MKERVIVNLDDSDVRYLKRAGINRSKFMRQAVEAHKKGTWSYDYED